MIRDTATKKSIFFVIKLGILARILVMLKDSLLASKIGVNFQMDTYLLALSTITLITKLVGDGLIVCLIPLLQEIRLKYGQKRVVNFTNNLLNITGIFSLGLMVILYFIAPLLIRLSAPGFKTFEMNQAIGFFRLGLPIVVTTWIRSIGGGFLQSGHAFRAGAKGGVANAVVNIIYLLCFASFGLEGLMITGTIAILTQIYIIVKTMKTKEYSYAWKFDLKDEYLYRGLKYFIPIIIGIGVTDLNLTIDNAIASTLPIGSITELNYANQIISLFLALFTTAIVTVIFPKLSESHQNEDQLQFNKGIKETIGIITSITVPITIILMVLPTPIVKIFFERGVFNERDSLFTAAALGLYAIGFTATALMPFVTRIYYATKNMITPILISVIVLVVNIVLDLSLAPILGAKGVALGTSLSISIGVLVGLYDINKRLYVWDTKELSKTLMKNIVATVLMILVVVGVYYLMIGLVGDSHMGGMATIILASLAGVGLYYGCFKFLKI